MNGETDRNGLIYNGPSLVLRGITSSQINTKHAFLIYLTFKIRQPLIFRNLEETKVIQAICILSNDVEGNNIESIVNLNQAKERLKERLTQSMQGTLNQIHS